MSPSALSHAMRGLEERLGVRLMARTTRSVAPTEAGERLLQSLNPALADIKNGLDAMAEWRGGECISDRPRSGARSLAALRLASQGIGLGIGGAPFERG